MKKSLAMALAASFVMSAAGTVFAAEASNPADLKIDGSVTVQYRNDEFKNDVTAANNKTVNGLKTTIVLNAEKNLTKNLDFYSRITYQSFGNSDAETKFSDYKDDKYNGAIDAFGFKYNNAGFNYTLGSQALTLGATGLIYDNGYIGKHALPYVATASGKLGATDVRAIYARTNYQDGITNDKFYGVEANYAVNDKSTVGALVIRENVDSIAEPAKVTAYAVNTSYKFTDKLKFVGEYVKTNEDTDNKGYVGAFTYKSDDKNTFGASFWRVEEYASLYDANFGGMTTFWANAKGYTLSWNHKLGKDVTLNVADHIFDKINDDSYTGITADRTSFRAGVTVNF